MFAAAEVRAVWEDAERILDATTDEDPDYDALQLTVEALRWEHERITPSQVWNTPAMIAHSHGTIGNAKAILRAVGAK